MAESLISVVLPTRNRADLLRRAVASVLSQTHRNLELIVVDDGSADHTRDVLAAVEDGRLQVVHHAESVGAAAARNAGIRSASGEFIAFQDDDDIWLVDKLEKQIRALANNPGHEWCICGNIRVREGKARYIGGRKFIYQIGYRESEGGGRPNWSLIATPGWLVKRTLLLEAGGFDERVRSFDDWELALRLSKRTEPVFVDEPLWIQDWWFGSGLTRNERAQAEDLRLIMKEHGNLWHDRPDVRARHWYEIGRLLTLKEPPPAGRKELWESIKLKPSRIRAWIALAASLLGVKVNRGISTAIRRMRRSLRGVRAHSQDSTHS